MAHTNHLIADSRVRLVIPAARKHSREIIPKKISTARIRIDDRNVTVRRAFVHERICARSSE